MQSLDAAVTGLRDPHSLPSARVLAAMAADHDHSFTDFVRARSEAARQTLLTQPFATEMQARFVEASVESIEAQKAIEAADTMPFEIYRQQYVSPARLGLGARTRRAVTV